jgi:Transposase DDE domain group 1
LPAPQTARDFLDAFDEAVPPLWQGERCQVQGEGERLQGLAKANRRLIAFLQERRPQATATLDIDATILESQKRSALPTYDGRTGYQPVVALWAEQDVILADEFRDGNVPAGTGNRRLVERAVAMLPPGVVRTLVRADSAAYEQDLLRWLDVKGIGYGISADMRAAPRRPPRSALGARRASWRRRSRRCPTRPGRSSARTATPSDTGPRCPMCRATVSRPRTGRRRRATW